MKLYSGILVRSCAVLLLLLSACVTPVKKDFPPNSFVVSGRINPVGGSKSLKGTECWVLECGSSDLRQLKYYQLSGEKEIMDRLHEEDMKVTVRIVERPDLSTSCNVGTMVEVLEIVEARSKTN